MTLHEHARSLVPFHLSTCLARQQRRAYSLESHAYGVERGGEVHEALVVGAHGALDVLPALLVQPGQAGVRGGHGAGVHEGRVGEEELAQVDGLGWREREG